jgi:hypothetical protein
MKKLLFLVTTLLILVTLRAGAEIAVKPEITGLFILHQNVEDINNMMVSKDDLINNKVLIEVQTNNADDPTAKVEVSLDGGANWVEATGQAGKYSYIFVPEDKDYKITARATDAKDQVSRSYSRIKLVYSPKTNEDNIRQMMLDLAQAYQYKDKKAFMVFISPDYQGNYDNLRDYLQQIFNQFDNINFKIYVNKVTITGDRAKVDFNWERQVFVKGQSTPNAPEAGNSTFTLIRAKSWQVLQGIGNEIFGIASTSQGTTVTPPPDQVPQSIPFNPVTTVMEGTAALQQWQGFGFASQSILTQTDPSRDILFEGQALFANPNGGICDMGAVNFNDIDQAPTSGYQPQAFNLAVGNCYAVQTNDGKYAKLQITALNPFNSITIHWVYQPNGSRSF